MGEGADGGPVRFGGGLGGVFLGGGFDILGSGVGVFFGFGFGGHFQSFPFCSLGFVLGCCLLSGIKFYRLSMPAD